MKILVLGAGGMAGHVIATYLAKDSNNSVDTLSRRVKLNDETHLLDVTDETKLTTLLEDNKYDAVINCIALLVGPSDEDKPLAVKVNSLLPRFLEKQLEGTSTKLIHISTDGVFKSSDDDLIESSTRDGESFYGQSKALGEVDSAKDLTIRLSIIGPTFTEEGTGLLNWFLKEEGEIFGFTNSLWNGITTLELAKFIETALGSNVAGIYHLATTEPVSKYDLLNLLKDEFGKDTLMINAKEGSSINSILKNTREDFIYKLPSYSDMIKELHMWIKENPDLYSHYE